MIAHQVAIAACAPRLLEAPVHEEAAEKFRQCYGMAVAGHRAVEQIMEGGTGLAESCARSAFGNAQQSANTARVSRACASGIRHALEVCARGKTSHQRCASQAPPPSGGSSNRQALAQLNQHAIQDINDRERAIRTLNQYAAVGAGDSIQAHGQSVMARLCQQAAVTATTAPAEAAGVGNMNAAPTAAVTAERPPASSSRPATAPPAVAPAPPVAPVASQPAPAAEQPGAPASAGATEPAVATDRLERFQAARHGLAGAQLDQFNESVESCSPQYRSECLAELRQHVSGNATARVVNTSIGSGASADEIFKSLSESELSVLRQGCRGEVTDSGLCRQTIPSRVGCHAGQDQGCRTTVLESRLQQTPQGVTWHPCRNRRSGSLLCD